MTSARLTLISLTLLLGTVANAGSTVENVRIWSDNGKTRVVLDLNRSVEHNIFTLRSPDRLVIDLKDSRLAASLTRLPDGAGTVRSIRSGVRADGKLRVVLDLDPAERRIALSVKAASDGTSDYRAYMSEGSGRTQLGSVLGEKLAAATKDKEAEAEPDSTPDSTPDSEVAAVSDAEDSDNEADA